MGKGALEILLLLLLLLFKKSLKRSKLFLVVVVVLFVVLLCSCSYFSNDAYLMSLAHKRHLPQEILEPWEGLVLTLLINNREFKILRRRCHLKSVFASFETSARLTQHAHFVKCGRTLLEANF